MRLDLPPASKAAVKGGFTIIGVSQARHTPHKLFRPLCQGGVLAERAGKFMRTLWITGSIKGFCNFEERVAADSWLTSLEAIPRRKRRWISLSLSSKPESTFWKSEFRFLTLW